MVASVEKPREEGASRDTFTFTSDVKHGHTFARCYAFMERCHELANTAEYRDFENWDKSQQPEIPPEAFTFMNEYGRALVKLLGKKVVAKLVKRGLTKVYNREGDYEPYSLFVLADYLGFHASPFRRVCPWVWASSITVADACADPFAAWLALDLPTYNVVTAKEYWGKEDCRLLKFKAMIIGTARLCRYLELFE